MPASTLRFINLKKTFKIKEQLNSIKKNTWEKAEARKRVENFKEKREKILKWEKLVYTIQVDLFFFLNKTPWKLKNMTAKMK